MHRVELTSTTMVPDDPQVPQVARFVREPPVAKEMNRNRARKNKLSTYLPT